MACHDDSIINIILVIIIIIIIIIIIYKQSKTQDNTHTVEHKE